MIYYDPGDLTDRIPGRATSLAQPLAYLDATTGADWLVTASAEPLALSDPLTPLARLELKQRLEHGLLVQRKSGKDLLNSLPALQQQGYAMAQWAQTVPVVLLAVGQFEQVEAGKNQMTGLDGLVTSTYWNAYSAALISWGLRGGLVWQVADEDEFLDWLVNLEKKLVEYQAEPIKPVRLYQQLINPTPAATLETLPGIGSRRAADLLEQYRTVIGSLEAITLPDGQVGLPATIIQRDRAYLGIPDDHYIGLLPRLQATQTYAILSDQAAAVIFSFTDEEIEKLYQERVQHALHV